MLKKIEIPVPIHIKKFIEGEYVQYVDKNGYCRVDKRSQLGKLIMFASRMDPYPKKHVPPKDKPLLKLAYYDESYSRYFPTDRIDDFIVLLDEYFRQCLIQEVRAKMAITNNQAYTPFVSSFLQRYNIEADIDIDLDTARKIYRDYQRKIHRKFQKNISVNCQ